MTQRFGYTAAAMLFATTLAWAQTPQTPQTPEPGEQQREMGGEEKTVTVVGCLKREADVPGRSPNVAEQAGMGEDYILTEAAEATAAGSTSPSSSSAAGSTSGMSSLKVEGIDDEQLQQHVNKRVEVTGTIDDPDWQSRAGSTGTTQPGTTQPGTTQPGTTETGQPGQPGTTTPGATQPGMSSDDDLPEIEATSIREVSGACQSPM